MTVAETISKKIIHLPIWEQKEVLDIVEQMEMREKTTKPPVAKNGSEKHALTELAEMAVDMGVTDLADRHDFYAHGKLED